MSKSHQALLLDIRRNLELILKRVDDALSDGSPRRMQIPVTQSFPQGYDFREDPEGLRMGLGELADRVQLVSMTIFNRREDLHNEVCLRAAEARLFQLQAEENSSEWETAVGIIRTLTRLVAEQRPGFVYGLSSVHNADWGKKIEDILAVYTPIPLEPNGR